MGLHIFSGTVEWRCGSCVQKLCQQPTPTKYHVTKPSSTPEKHDESLTWRQTDGYQETINWKCHLLDITSSADLTGSNRGVLVTVELLVLATVCSINIRKS